MPSRLCKHPAVAFRAAYLSPNRSVWERHIEGHAAALGSCRAAVAIDSCTAGMGEDMELADTRSMD